MSAPPRGQLSIGAFARLSRLSIKTLRFYHQEGLLAPSRIDARSGYRYYEASQLARAEQIRALRASDISLVDIRTFLDRPSERAALIEQQRARLAQSAIDVMSQLAALDHVDAPEPIAIEPFRWPTTIVLDVVETAPLQSFAFVIPRMFGQLFGALTAARLAPIDAPMGIQRIDAHGEYKGSPEAVRVELAVPIAREENGDWIGARDAVAPAGLARVELASANAFRTLHKGHFATIGQTWQRFAHALHAQDAAIGDATFEIYRVGPYQTQDPRAWIVELVWIA